MPYKENHIVSQVELQAGEKRVSHARRGWQYAPDLLEKWLNDEAKQGRHLYKIDDDNTFYFVKREPAELPFIADYKKCSDDATAEENIKNGWILFYNSSDPITIWGCDANHRPDKPFKHSSDALRQYARNHILLNLLYSAAICAVFVPFNSFGFFRDSPAFKIIYLAALAVIVLFTLGNALRLTTSYIRIRRDSIVQKHGGKSSDGQP